MNFFERVFYMVYPDSMTQNGVAEGDGTSSVKIYDFKKALRLSIEQVRALTKIHEVFAYHLSSTISAQLRSIVQVEVTGTKQMVYGDFITQLPKNTVLSVLENGGQEGRIVWELNQSLAFSMIDRLMGGKGIIGVWERSSLTPVETTVLKRLLERFIQNLQKAWGDIAGFKLKVLDFELNPQFLQLTAPTDTVIVVGFQVHVGQNAEQMQLCLPYIFLEPFIQKLSSHNRHGHAGKNNGESGLLQERIGHLTVPVCAELGRASITIEEFLGLSVNDVIQLDQLVDEPLKVKINEQIKYLAHPGTKKSRMAVKIEQVIEGEDSNE
jgi:flagellar motor switch protein FliM